MNSTKFINMKYIKMKTIVLILSLFLATSCSNDDDNSTVQNNQEIVATWYLIKYEPGFSPTDNYTDEIQWTFNSDNTVDVVIENGTSVNFSLPLNSNGNYTYSIEDDEIMIENVNYKYEINGNVLIIEDLIGQSADGQKLTFEKKE